MSISTRNKLSTAPLTSIIASAFIEEIAYSKESVESEKFTTRNVIL